MPALTRPLCLIPLLFALACSGGEASPSPTAVPDSDGDGIADVDDCGPQDALVYPGASETGSDDAEVTAGDGKDNDCDGQVDEGTDAFDDDGDGYSEDASVGGAADCDDEDAGAYPGANEIPYDGVDQDCDGFDLDDVDGDGFPSTEVSGGQDCDDQDDTVYPDAPEDGGSGAQLGDDVDNDCDGAVDEGMLDTDDDGDGQTEQQGDCDDADPGRYLGLTEEPYDGIDQDCDGEDLTDVDRDGFDSTEVEGGRDCDDTDAATYPTAPEQCDGEDNDCDGLVPEDEALIPYYADDDDDGYGDEGDAIDGMACDPPEGRSSQGGDCDDAHATVHPGAEEICDDLDNDCDPSTNEDAGEQVYPDEDGDGWGAVTDPVTVSLCDPGPEGAVAISGDCNDSDPATHPGAPELCDGANNDCDASTVEGPELDVDGDGIPVCDEGGFTWDCDDTNPLITPGRVDWRDDGLDNDCDGTADGITPSAGLAPWFFGEEANANLGRGLAGGVDLDGDGFTDLLVGAPRQNVGAQTDPGRVYVRYGAAAPPATQLISAAGGSIDGITTSAYTGDSVTFCGDLNGDGRPDFIVGAPQDRTTGLNKGSAFLFFADGGDVAPNTPASEADVQIINQDGARYLGRKIQCLDDLNGDGLADVVLNAADGRVAMYLGQESWPDLMDDAPDDGDDIAGPDVLLTGADPDGDGDQISITSGDLNGDLFADLVIGDSRADSKRGRVYIYWGRAFLPDLSGDLAAHADVIIDGEDAAMELGAAVDARSDLNGDGIVDLVIGAPAAGADLPSHPSVSGRVFVFYGGIDTLPAGEHSSLEAQLSFGALANGGRAGTRLMTLPDLTGDGTPDLVVVAPGAQTEGTVYALTGRPTWPEHQGDLSLDDESIFTLVGADSDQLGASLTALGSFTGAASGLAVSAMLSDVSGNNLGQVFFIEGRPAPAP